MTIYSMAECEQMLRDCPYGCVRLMEIAQGNVRKYSRIAKISQRRSEAAKARWQRWRLARKAAA